MDDRKLLREYVEQGSERAFAELVNRHTDLVYSAALRQTNGDPHLAEEIAQVVFLTLARKARLLSTRVILAGWLLDATRREAAGMRRRWLRREQREKFAAEMNPQPDPNPLDAAWSRIAPLLDESLARLRETERDAMVLHYLRRMTFKEVGEALDLSEEAARKRVSRALEELRRFFVSRGVVFPAATIGLLLSSFAVQAAPVSLAPATAKLALMAASAQAGGFAASILELLIMTAKAKTAVIAVAGIVALITMVLQKQQNARLRA